MRFQAEIPSRDAALLTRLMQELEVQSNAELLAEALAITWWAVKERRKGRTVVSVGSAGPERVLVSPFLERAAPEDELPRVEMNFTLAERDHLAALMTSEPPKPNERLVRAMRRR